MMAEFQSSRRNKSREGPDAVEIQFRGKFYRDRNGNTRTDYFDASPRGDSIAVSMLWSPHGKTVTFVSFAERTVQRLQGPRFPAEDKWMPAGKFALKPTNDERTIYGLECKRVFLQPIQTQLTEDAQGELWVAFDWGLVMLDVMEMAGEELRWEVVRVDRIEPEASVFNVPEGFTGKD
jgi:hypothetical protein